VKCLNNSDTFVTCMYLQFEVYPIGTDRGGLAVTDACDISLSLPVLKQTYCSIVILDALCV
jgi:hypothetical protein